MEQRKHPRIRVDGMTIDVSDGIRCCAATVADISQGGLCLSEMGRKFGKKFDRLTVVAVSGEQHFKFRVKPRWEMVGPWHKTVGVEIDQAPWQWTSFVLALEGQRPF